MALARPDSLDRRAAGPGKRGFVNRVVGFANRVWPSGPLPGFPMLWVAGAGAALLMIVVGAFGTGEMPLPTRVGFWLLLMAWNTAKWQLWFALTVRKSSDWPLSAAISIALGLPIPFEIGVAAWLVGIPGVMPDPLTTWTQTLVIGAGIFAVCMLVVWRVAQSADAPAAAPPPGGLLDRARVDADSLAAIEAEDHYCRVRRRDGASALVHYRFGDALSEVAGLDGAQVHRGAWVAGAAVRGGRREGRRWLLLLADGATIAVSAPHVAEARRRGWLRAPG